MDNVRKIEHCTYEFLEYLRLKGITDSFFSQVRAQGFITLEDNEIDNARRIVRYSYGNVFDHFLDWRETVEGFEFWREVSSNWNITRSKIYDNYEVRGMVPSD
jgi:hypothetical protein